MLISYLSPLYQKKEEIGWINENNQPKQYFLIFLTGCGAVFFALKFTFNANV